MKVSSSDWIPVHKNRSFSLKLLDFQIIIWTYLMKMCSIYILLLTCWLYCTASFLHMENIHLVHLVCRSQTRQTLTTFKTSKKNMHMNT